jgi:hypothetical protein
VRFGVGGSGRGLPSGSRACWKARHDAALNRGEGVGRPCSSIRLRRNLMSMQRRTRRQDTRALNNYLNILHAILDVTVDTT